MDLLMSLASRLKKDLLLCAFIVHLSLCYAAPGGHRLNSNEREHEIKNPLQDRSHVKDPHEIPQYILDHAPIVHLHSEEEFWPCDLAEHLKHVTAHFNYAPLRTPDLPLNLTNLDQLNRKGGGRCVFLQSNDDVETRPDWLEGRENVPSELHHETTSVTELDKFPGLLERFIHGPIPETAHDTPKIPSSLSEDRGVDRIAEGNQQVLGVTGRQSPHYKAGPLQNQSRHAKSRMLAGRSKAPAVLVVVDKGDGIVDAFWFFFYSYNLGNVVLNIRFGNHVGDWEHTLVRFQHGKPIEIFYSQHYFGEAYTYEAVRKVGKRPVAYSAIGTHAMYGTAGTHKYILPFGLLHDSTDQGPLWDPLLNVQMYTYDYLSDWLRPGNFTPEAPVEWFYYAGHWGDKRYPMTDPRQYEFAGQYHYVNGPRGPRFKNLGREEVCQGFGPCVVKDWMTAPRNRVVDMDELEGFGTESECTD